MAKYTVRDKELKELRFEKAIEALMGGELDTEKMIQFFGLIQQIADMGDQDIKDLWDSIIGEVPVVMPVGDVTVGEFVKTDLFPNDIFIKIADPDGLGKQAADECLVIRIKGLVLTKAPNTLEVTLLPDVSVNISNVS